MKVDLTSRDIELLLLLLNDLAAVDEVNEKDAPIYSIEEIALMEKLETALRRGDLTEEDFLESNAGTVYH